MRMVMLRSVLPVFSLVLGLAPEALATVEGRFDRTLTVNGAVSLTATEGSGGIAVVTGPDGSVRIAGEIRGNPWTTSADELARAVQAVEAKPPIVQEGNTIRVGHIEDERIGRLLAITYTITVPRQASVTTKTGSGSQSVSSLAGPVHASSGSGSVKIAAIDGAVSVETGSGSIRVERAGGGAAVSTGSGAVSIGSVTGDLRARTGSSAVNVEQVANGTAEISSGSGHIDVRNLQGGLKASTASASIHVGGTPTADWRTSTSSGSITLEIPAGSSFRLQARTDSGSVKSDHTLETTTAEKRELVGSAGKGGALVDARSHSGSITVSRR